MSILIHINEAQRLYILSCGSSWTCLGFATCEGRKLELAIEMDEPLALTVVGTAEAYAEYERLVVIAAQRHRTTGWRSKSELTRQLIGLEGWRVEVISYRGEKQRFIVGKSTGFIPVHLALPRRNSSGGPPVHGSPFKTINLLEKVQ